MINRQGWINLYKPKNITSFKAVKLLKKRFSIDKIGHAGTLDPLAEGILPIALGKTTKLIPFISNDLKAYKFTITWGTQTTTDDSEGEIISHSKHIPSQENILSKYIKFEGNISQIPPKVSAVKINGTRAYKLARNNLNFTIKPKNVFVKKIDLLKHDYNKTIFKIICGKGFYIRSLARDLALDLDTFGHISALERLKVGKFSKENSILLDDLLKIGERHPNFNFILSTLSMLDDILAIEINDENDLRNLSFGKSIKINEEHTNNSLSSNLDKKLVFLSNNGDIVSFGKLIGNLFKPKKILI